MTLPKTCFFNSREVKNNARRTLRPPCALNLSLFVHAISSYKPLGHSHNCNPGLNCKPNHLLFLSNLHSRRWIESDLTLQCTDEWTLQSRCQTDNPTRKPGLPKAGW